MPADIDVRLEGQRFNFCVRAIIRSSSGAVLACSLPEATWFWLPGGRVRTGETTHAALERELREELGLELKPGPLALMVENFFTLEDRFHEIGFYFVVPLPEGTVLADTIDQENGSAFRWIDRDQLPSTDLRPAFLRQVLCRDLTRTEHVVHIE